MQSINGWLYQDGLLSNNQPICQPAFFDLTSPLISPKDGGPEFGGRVTYLINYKAVLGGWGFSYVSRIHTAYHRWSTLYFRYLKFVADDSTSDPPRNFIPIYASHGFREEYLPCSILPYKSQPVPPMGTYICSNPPIPRRGSKKQLLLPKQLGLSSSTLSKAVSTFQFAFLGESGGWFFRFFFLRRKRRTKKKHGFFSKPRKDKKTPC